jgi:HEAT repeat protein
LPGNAEDEPVPLPRLEPGNAYLAHLREGGHLYDLARIIDDPESSRHLRQRATLHLASMKPGGGKASALRGETEPAVIPILGPLLEQDRNSTVRRSAAYGLRRTGDQAAVRPLLYALSDTDRATRTHAVIGLGALRAREAVEPLSELLNDRHHGGAAAKALVEIGDERALAPLRDAAGSTKSGRRRDKLSRCVVDLERRVGLLPMAGNQ